MDAEYEIVGLEEPAWDLIGPAIQEYNTRHAGTEGYGRLCFVLRAPAERIAGGVIAEMVWQWLHVDLMWVTEELRGRGYGRRLLTALEDEARRRGALHAFLDTFSFQAPGFYEKLGYRVVGELADFPAGHVRYFMSKQL